MFKTRARKAEEEAKKEEGYIPTKDLLSDDDKANNNPTKHKMVKILNCVLILVYLICPA